ncbi:hypothetical protein LWI29_002400 [Acer saccharum]|uniref:Uncharacterized protein n=1 Tax=Acer saccharum TaxID=4024 RepID=A0AA39RBJ5_ACESA|nr:hypothetical protein LWI29_002400 [Acer saccharum]
MTSPAGPSSSPPDIPDYSFPPELMTTLPPNHQPSLDQIQTFAKAHLPVYLPQINSQDCRHTINNLSRPFLDPFIMPPFYYFSPQLLWPYRYNPHKRLLWTANTSYEWFTTYDYQKTYPNNLQISLLNFLCDVNHVSTDEVFILPDIPRDSSQSWNPFQDSYMIDS